MVSTVATPVVPVVTTGIGVATTSTATSTVAGNKAPFLAATAVTTAGAANPSVAATMVVDDAPQGWEPFPDPEEVVGPRR